MTREEREAFVRRAWFGRGTIEDGIKKIVTKWESDIADQVEAATEAAFTRGIQAEQERYGAQG